MFSKIFGPRTSDNARIILKYRLVSVTLFGTKTSPTLVFLTGRSLTPQSSLNYFDGGGKEQFDGYIRLR